MSAASDVRVETERFFQVAKDLERAIESGSLVDVVVALDEIEKISKRTESVALQYTIASWIEKRNEAERAKRRTY